MNKTAVAQELIKVAKLIEAIEFDTQDAYDKYLKDHPDADKSNHSVKTQEKKDSPEKVEDEAAVRTKNPEYNKEINKKMNEHYDEKFERHYDEIRKLPKKQHKALEDIIGAASIRNVDVEELKKRADESLSSGKVNPRILKESIESGKAFNQFYIDAGFKHKVGEAHVAPYEKANKKLDALLKHINSKSDNKEPASKKLEEPKKSFRDGLDAITEKHQAAAEKIKKSPHGEKLQSVYGDVLNNAVKKDVNKKIDSMIEEGVPVAEIKHMAETGKAYHQERADLSSSYKGDESVSDYEPSRQQEYADKFGRILDHLGKKNEQKPMKEQIKEKVKGLHKPAPVKKNTLEKVKKVMGANGIKDGSDEIKELAGFKKTLGQRVPQKDVGKYYVRNEAKLKADFISNMNPANYSSPEAFKSAQERMQKTPASDFGKILAAINDEEEE